jgi:hypothetical protein
MRNYTSKISKILRTSAIITLFCLSSASAYLGGDEDKGDISTSPSIQEPRTPSPELEIPGVESISPSTIPSAQPVDPLLELQRELQIAQLRRQIAEEEAARLIAQQYTAPPPVDPLVSLLGGLLKAASGSRAQERVERNASTEVGRFFESFENAQKGLGWRHHGRLAKEEIAREQKVNQALNTSLSYMESHYKLSRLLNLQPEERASLLQKANEIVKTAEITPDTGAIVKAYKAIYGVDPSTP